VKGRLMLSDGRYERLRPEKGERGHRHQDHMHRLARKAEEQLEQSQRTLFTPHRAASAE
jgi:hypothetical protein